MLLVWDDESPWIQESNASPIQPMPVKLLVCKITDVATGEVVDRVTRYDTETGELERISVADGRVLLNAERTAVARIREVRKLKIEPIGDGRPHARLPVQVAPQIETVRRNGGVGPPASNLPLPK